MRIALHLMPLRVERGRRTPKKIKLPAHKVCSQRKMIRDRQIPHHEAAKVEWFWPDASKHTERRRKIAAPYSNSGLKVRVELFIYLLLKTDTKRLSIFCHHPKFFYHEWRGPPAKLMNANMNNAIPMSGVPMPLTAYLEKDANLIIKWPLEKTRLEWNRGYCFYSSCMWSWKFAVRRASNRIFSAYDSYVLSILIGAWTENDS